MSSKILPLHLNLMWLSYRSNRQNSLNKKSSANVLYGVLSNIHFFFLLLFLGTFRRASNVFSLSFTLAPLYLQYWRYRLGYGGATETREAWIVIVDELEKKEKYKGGTNKLTQIHVHNQDELAQTHKATESTDVSYINLCQSKEVRKHSK